jgi:hypothetical protein
VYTRVACIFIFQEYTSPWRVPRYSLSAGLSYIGLDRTRLDRDGSSSFPLSLIFFFFVWCFFAGNRSRSRFKCQRSSVIINEILLHQTELCCSFETSRASRGCGETKAKTSLRENQASYSTLSLPAGVRYLYSFSSTAILILAFRDERPSFLVCLSVCL